jgi:hypothetical protein
MNNYIDFIYFNLLLLPCRMYHIPHQYLKNKIKKCLYESLIDLFELKYVIIFIFAKTIVKYVAIKRD